MVKEFVGTVADLKIGDKVFGTDGQWHKVKEIFPEFLPQLMFGVYLENGWCECSGDHNWHVFLNIDQICSDEHLHENMEEGNNNGKNHEHIVNLGDMETARLPEVLVSFGCCVHIGKPDGPMLLDVHRVNPKPSSCIMVDSEDHQFEIILNENDDIKDITQYNEY